MGVRKLATIGIAALAVACSSGPRTGPATSTSTSTSTTAATTTAAATVSAATGKSAQTDGTSDELFDQNKVHTFALDVDETELAKLDSDPAAEEYVEGVLTFDGREIGPVGVRYKGSIGAFIGCTSSPNPFQPDGAKTCRKLSLKLKINWHDPDATFYGVRRIQLHSQRLDASKMHERLGYWLYREMGVPVPRSVHARVEINGAFSGVYSLTEEIDGRFTRATFDDGTGNLYKEVWPLDSNGQPRPASEFVAALQTNRDEDPTAEIVTSFGAELAAAAPTDRVDVLRKWIDLDVLLRTFVVDRAIAHDDGPLHWYCRQGCAPHNFYWYEEPTSRKLYLVPWDLDNAFDAISPSSPVSRVIKIADPFGQVSNDCQPIAQGSFGLQQRSAACDPIIGTAAALTAEFDTIRAELLAGPMSIAVVDGLLAAWSAQIESLVAEEARQYPDAPSVEAWRRGINELQAMIETSRSGPGR